MKKVIVNYGLISGSIVTVFMLISMNYYSHCNNNNVSESTSMVIGFATMILAFAFIYIGIKNYRDKVNDGLVSFGVAFKIGFLIALIASTMYAIAWTIDCHFFMPDFMDKYAAKTIENLKASGATLAVVDEKTKELQHMASLYKNPIFTFLLTYIEILPLGLLVSLISALVLKRKNKS